jgi:hypothetical protein
MAAGDGQVIKRLSKKTKIGLGAVVLALAAFGFGGGPSWIYINWIKEEPPPKLSFDLRDQATTDTSTP